VATIYLDYAGNAIAQSLGPLVLVLGTSGNDSLIGGSGRDAFQASGGIDTLAGGLADDTYIVQNSATKVIEAAGGGIDTVKTTAHYILPDNVENLYILGYTPKSGTAGFGNALSNLIVGDVNTQTITGLGGNDVLVGGGGSDMFVFGIGSGRDVITDFTAGKGAGLDYVRLQGYGLTTFDQVKAAMTQVGADVVLKLSATDDVTFRSTTIAAFTADNFKLPIDLKKFQLTFSDEFDTLRLQTLGDGSTGTWAPEFGFGGFGTKASHYIGYYTGELQMFVDPTFKGSTDTALGLNPFTVNNGVLSIQARPTTAAEKAALWPSATQTFDYVSGMISSVSSFRQTYGYFELRAKLPSGQGAWPCFWLLSSRPGDMTEVDILEARGQLANINNTSLHHYSYPNAQIGSSVYTPGGDTAFHTYGLLWDKDYLVWYVDGAEVYRLPTPADMNVPMYLVVTLAVGAWAGTADPVSLAATTFDVDYVRAYSALPDGQNITGTAGDDTLTGTAGADTLTGLGGNDTYVVNYLGDVVMEAAGGGTDLVQTSLLSHVLAANIEKLAYTGTGNFAGTGNSLANVITGGVGNDTLIGDLGDDTLDGGSGNDSLDGGSGTDVAIYAGASSRYRITADGSGGFTVQDTQTGETDTLARIEALGFSDGQVNLSGPLPGIWLLGGAAADTLTGTASSDTLDGGAGADRMVGGLGDDLYEVENTDDVVVETAGGGFDTVEVARTWTVTAGAAVERVFLTGISSLNLTGNLLSTRLEGNSASNIIDDGGGSDTLAGMGGNDTYIVRGTGTVVIEAAGEGVDSVRTDLSAYLLTDNVENLTFTGTGAFAGTGNALANVITGGTSNDTLNGGAGADRLVGDVGNDTYIVDSVSDAIVENVGEGYDTQVTSLASAIAATNIEALVYSGTANFSGYANGTGTAITGGIGTDTLVGAAGNDTLDGGLGADALTGGGGDDVFVVDNGGDRITEASGGGTDTVLTTLGSFVLSTELENLTYTGAATFNGTGNASANKLTGGAGADTLDGGAGDDTLDGAGGTDIAIYAGAASRYVITTDGAGSYFVRDTLLGATDRLTNIENALFSDGLVSLGSSVRGLSVTGGAAADNLVGGNGDDTIDGAGDIDTMAGGAGSDLYIVENSGDIVVEVVGSGFDTVQTSKSWVATAGSEIERVVLTSTASLNLTGNLYAMTLEGNAATNTLDDGGGADTLKGLAGNDTYVVRNAATLVVEAAGEGADQVRTTLDSYVLTDNVENLTSIGSGNFSGTGNGLANVITGGAGQDTLDGGVGADRLVGGLGNDTYVIDNASDAIVENAGEGYDTQLTTLASAIALANVEALTYIGTAAFVGYASVTGTAVTGGISADRLVGAAGNDTLDGGVGADTLSGAAGDDVFIIDNAGDRITELAAGGFDTVRTNLATYALGAELEALIYTGTAAFSGTGNGLANRMTGGANADALGGGGGDDTLDGGIGADTLDGGLGDDLYLVDNSADAIVEAAASGLDTVQTSTSWVVTAGAQVDRVMLTGAGNLNLTGNLFGMTLEGNSGLNTLDDGGGADILKGMAGNDTYVVRNAATVVAEASGEGLDTVNTTLNSYGLTADVETLSFIGTGDFTGQGNALDNLITGGAGNDSLEGGLGSDTLNGGAGLDVAVYAGAASRYVVTGDGLGTFFVQDTQAAGLDVLTGIENLRFADGLFQASSFLVGVNLTGTAAAETLTGTVAADTLDGAGGADTLVGGLGNDVYRIDDSAEVVTELVGGGFDIVQIAKSWVATAGSAIERIFMAGTANLNLTGNALSMVLEGNAGLNTLDDGGGADTLKGMAGNDIYIVRNAATVVVEAAGEGYDAVRTALSAYVLTDNLDTLTYTGTGHFSGTGNALANVITGGVGNDTLNGGLGTDRLVGGLGDDTYYVDGDAVVENAGEGFDTMITSQASAIASANIEALTFSGIGNFAGYANATGTVLTGGAGNDTLVSGAGIDVLIGGSGNDMLTGGASADVFRFDSFGSGLERITDFQAGLDHIALKGTAFGVVSLADLAFVSGVAPQPTDTRATLLYDTATGALFFDATGGDGADKVQIATLSNKAVLTAGDFWLV